MTKTTHRQAPVQRGGAIPDRVDPSSLVESVEDLLGEREGSVEAQEARVRQVTAIQGADGGWSIRICSFAVPFQGTRAEAERHAQVLIRGLVLAHAILKFLRESPRTWEEITSTIAGVPSRFDLSAEEALRVHQAAVVLDGLAVEGRVQRAPGEHRAVDLYLPTGCGWRTRPSKEGA